MTKTKISTPSVWHTIFGNTLAFYLVVSQMFFWPGILAYGPQEMFIQYSAILFLGLMLMCPQRRSIISLWLGLALIYCLIHTLSMHFVPRARLQLMNVALGVLTIKVIADRVDLNPRAIGKAFVFFTILNLIWIGLQHFNQDPFFTPIEPDKKATIDTVGLLGARYAIGASAALMTPFIYAVHPLCVLLTLPLLWASQASTCVGAWIFAVLFITFFRHRRVFWYLASFLLVGGLAYLILYDMPTGQFMKRLKIWQFGLNRLANTGLWWGNGIGSWAATGFMMRKENGEPEWWSWCHNEFLQIMYEQGIFFLMLIYAYFKGLMRGAWKALKLNPWAVYTFASMIALLVVSFFHFPFHVGRLVGISLYILAMMEAQRKEYDEKQLETDPVSVTSTA